MNQRIVYYIRFDRLYVLNFCIRLLQSQRRMSDLIPVTIVINGRFFMGLELNVHTYRLIVSDYYRS